MREVVSAIVSIRWVSVNVERRGCQIIGIACWCDDGRICSSVLFCVPCRPGWAFTVTKWLVNYWSVMLGEPVPLGGSFQCFKQLSELLRSSSGVVGVNVEIVTVEQVAKLMRKLVVDEFGGQTINAILNFLLTNLRDEASSPVLLESPNLLRVSLFHYV